VENIDAFSAEARKKLSDLLEQRAKTDQEIIKWKRVVDSLSAISGELEDDPSDVEVSALGVPSNKVKIKFTEGVRMVLQQSAYDRPINATAVRDQLINLGFDFSKYAQPLVPIHNCLKRLHEQGEVFLIKNSEGQTTGYTWVSPLERVLNQDAGRPKSSRTADAIPPHLRNLMKKDRK